jgi:hypothetical protein
VRQHFIRVVDPHHAVRADGITVATVPCEWGVCPEHHFYQPTECDGRPPARSIAEINARAVQDSERLLASQIQRADARRVSEDI